MTEKADYLEGQTRRNNLVVDGIPEPHNKSWKETENKVRCVINEKLHLDQGSPNFLNLMATSWVLSHTKGTQFDTLF